MPMSSKHAHLKDDVHDKCVISSSGTRLKVVLHTTSLHLQKKDLETLPSLSCQWNNLPDQSGFVVSVDCNHCFGVANTLQHVEQMSACSYL